MSSTLDGTAFVFRPFSESHAGNASELLTKLDPRTDKGISTYEDGILKPHTGVKSLITWNETVPSLAEAPIAPEVPSASEAPEPSADSEIVATVEPEAPAVDTDVDELVETDINGDKNLEHQQEEGHSFSLLHQATPENFAYYMPTYQFNHFPVYQPFYPPALHYFYQPVYQPQLSLPCDIAVAEANRPSWTPEYHKQISPSIERANRVLEEFKVYFRDGRTPDHLMQLRKICFLCRLCEARDLPNSVEGCIAVSSTPFISLFPRLHTSTDLFISLSSSAPFTSMSSTLSMLDVQENKDGISPCQSSARRSNSSNTAEQRRKSAQGGSEKRTHCSRRC